MNIQRLRTLTTGKLHTDITFVYEDLGYFMGESGLMTHMLPRAMNSVKPWLQQYVTDERFWDNSYDPEHIGDIELPEPTDAERAEMWVRFGDQPNPLAGKEVIVVTV